MSTLSRRDLLRVSAGAAAVAVPMGALTREAASAATAPTAAAASAGSAGSNPDSAGGLTDVFVDVGHEPVMFCVHDAQRGEVSILHGTDEVVVRDPQLVRRIMRAASRQAL
ncbi:MAG: hypothetical protein ACRDZZ_07560 [Ilumatobacteraceae bacterium]